jgi:hypothetical protein
MQEPTDITMNAAGDLPALLCDLTGMIPGWDPSRPASELVSALKQRLSNQPITKRKSRGKNMSRRKGQKVKIEPHGGWYTFRARVDVEGQKKRVFRRIQVSPIDPAAPGWLNASECYRKAVKMMAALEGRNEEVVKGDGKDDEVLVNPIDVNPTGVVPAEVAPTKPSVPTFAEQAKALMQELKDPSDPKARSTQKTWGSYLKVWLLPMLGDLPLDKINNTHLKDLVAWMKKGGPMPTRNQ